jgi:hypothetical protein
LALTSPTIDGRTVGTVRLGNRVFFSVFVHVLFGGQILTLKSIGVSLARFKFILLRITSLMQPFEVSCLREKTITMKFEMKSFTKKQMGSF